jgi:hypothetical protein
MLKFFRYCLIVTSIFSSFIAFSAEKRKPASDGGADPCGYLDRTQCRQAGYFCEYKPAQQTKGQCVAVNGGIEKICAQAYILARFGEKKVEDECYNKAAITKCQWNPGEYVDAGCYMKERFRRM